MSDENFDILIEFLWNLYLWCMNWGSDSPKYEALKLNFFSFPLPLCVIMSKLKQRYKLGIWLRLTHVKRGLGLAMVVCVSWRTRISFFQASSSVLLVPFLFYNPINSSMVSWVMSQVWGHKEMSYLIEKR